MDFPINFLWGKIRIFFLHFRWLECQMFERYFWGTWSSRWRNLSYWNDDFMCIWELYTMRNALSLLVESMKYRLWNNLGSKPLTFAIFGMKITQMIWQKLWVKWDMIIFKIKYLNFRAKNQRLEHTFKTSNFSNFCIFGVKIQKTKAEYFGVKIHNLKSQ